MYVVKVVGEREVRQPCNRGWVSGQFRTGPSREVRREVRVDVLNDERSKSHRTPPVGSIQ
jgi:hypothetical protein